jgi:hypothetical protein
MQAEIGALEESHTWTLVELPPYKKPIGCKWVYKVKFKSDGQVEHYKTRLLVKGSTQCEDLDYHEIFFSCGYVDYGHIIACSCCC